MRGRTVLVRQFSKIKIMRIFVILAAILLSSAAAPTEDCDSAVSEPTAAPADPPVHYRTETSDQVSRNTTSDKAQTSTKAKEKIKYKKLKNGNTEEVIVDTSRTKTKKDSVSDQYSQTKHTLTEDGLEDSTSLTQDRRHEVKLVDVVKKKDREVIIRDKDGNIISDKKKSHVKEKERKKEKDKNTSKSVHTVKKVATPPVLDDTPPVPKEDTLPSTDC